MKRTMNPTTHMALLLGALGLLLGCVSDPQLPVDGGRIDSTAAGVLVVNEGVWFQDNSTLTFHDPETGTTVQDFFRARNPGMRLGDLGNSIHIAAGRAYIPVTTSQTVEMLELPSGRSAGRLSLPPRSDPRQVVVVDSVTAFVSCLNDDSAIRFDPSTAAITGRVAVGPAPEGLCHAAGRIFVANSGYGVLRQSEPGASTLSVIDIDLGQEIDRLPVGTNPRDLLASARTGRIYVLYGLPGEPGGVAEVDPVALRVERQWPIDNTLEMALDDPAGAIYVIGADDGVWQIDLNDPAGGPLLLLASAGLADAGFYSVGTDTARGEIYIGFSSGFTTPGEVLVLGRDGAVRRRFPAGLNPGSFGAVR